MSNFREAKNFLRFIPWDTQTFGINTFEIVCETDEVLKEVISKADSGHYTFRASPLTSKSLLHELGFYYCDTLIEPYSSREQLVYFTHSQISISESFDIDEVAQIARESFVYDRFHRDFNINSQLADFRYENWLRNLYEINQVVGLKFANNIVGFWAYSENKILLHALSKKYRGKGLSKAFWYLACLRLFDAGYNELTSSISSSNLPALNLYASLGFKFRNASDIYHLVIN